MKKLIEILTADFSPLFTVFVTLVIYLALFIFVIYTAYS